MQIKSKTSIVIIFIIIFVVAASAFMFLDFKLSTSTTSADSTASTYSYSYLNNTEMNSSDNVCIYVDENDFLSRTLSGKLDEKLTEEGKMVYIVTEFKEKYDFPVLLVSVSNEDVFYTPFFCSASFDVIYLYSSSGETEYFRELKAGEKTAVVFSSNGSVKQKFLKEGELKFADSTRGIISSKAYQKHLAENVATNLLESFDKMPTSY